MSTSCVVADYIRTHKAAITADWERAVMSDLKELMRLERGALIDHLPEVLDGLSSWVEGQSAEAERAFSALADGHALQRLAFGFDLAVLNIEYAWLRRVVLQHLLSVPSTSDVRVQLLRLNDGMDRAILHAVRRYSEHRDYLRDRFIGILGHDLRGPLAAASAATTTLLYSERLADEDKKRVLAISRATERMASMVGDVLDFARGHLGEGIPTTPTACDMGEICRAAAAEVQMANPRVAIDLSLRGDLRGNFDRDRVLQAIGNLLNNAVQHGRAPISIAVWENEDRRALTTRVASGGEPIPPAVISRLFDAFSHATDSNKRGLGLGLYIVAQIARAHGGTCEVASSAQSTAFTIRWPRTPLAEVPDRGSTAHRTDP